MELHRLHSELLRREVRVLVVGCGGTGSSIIGGLPYLHQAMRAQGHPYGLRVTVMDGDNISPVNCVRQPFSRAEVGLNKGIVLVNRLNIFWGLDWEAVPENLTESHQLRQTDIVIGCVDTRAARAVIERRTTQQCDPLRNRYRQQRVERPVYSGRAAERRESKVENPPADSR